MYEVDRIYTEYSDDLLNYLSKQGYLIGYHINKWDEKDFENRPLPEELGDGFMMILPCRGVNHSSRSKWCSIITKIFDFNPKDEINETSCATMTLRFITGKFLIKGIYMYSFYWGGIHEKEYSYYSNNGELSTKKYNDDDSMSYIEKHLSYIGVKMNGWYFPPHTGKFNFNEYEINSHNIR